MMDRLDKIMLIIMSIVLGLTSIGLVVYLVLLYQGTISCPRPDKNDYVNGVIFITVITLIAFIVVFIRTLRER